MRGDLHDCAVHGLLAPGRDYALPLCSKSGPPPKGVLPVSWGAALQLVFVSEGSV